MLELLRRLTSGRLVWVTGGALTAVGIICLYLSDQVVQGWWQGTLDAFGVGLIVGGVVDVVVITGLNEAFAADQKRRNFDREAASMLSGKAVAFDDMRDLLARGGDQRDPRLREQLQYYLSAWENSESFRLQQRLRKSWLLRSLFRW